MHSNPMLQHAHTPTLHFALAGACRAASLYQLSLAPFLPDALALRLGLLDGTFLAPSIFSANFQMTYTSITCSNPIRRTGPAAALARWIFSVKAGLSFSPVRVIEMAFRANETVPASMARLLEEASQVKTSGVMAS